MGDAFGKAEGGSARQDVLLPISSCPFTTFPNPSTCHRCGLCLIDRIQTFYSQWRIVLLCRECFARIRSAQMCSYCFSLFPESENSFLDCLLCFRRVHRACVPLHHRNFSHSQLDAVKFFCIDCRPIPKLRGKDPKTSGCSASHTAFMVPLISGTKSISEKKVALHAKPKENVTKEKMVGMEFGELNRREFGAIQLVMEPSNINLSVSDEKMPALLHHQPINESDKISRSLFPAKEQCSCNAVLKTVDSDSCAHHSKIEDSTRNKSLPEDSLYSESMLASCPLFNTACPEDLILKETESSIKFPDSIDDGGNSSSEMLPCHSLNTWFNNAKPGDCDGEGLPKLKRKNIEAVGLDWSMKKYFRKRWSSERIIQTSSQSILSNSRLCEPENLDMIKQTSACSTDSPKNFSLQEKPKLKRKTIEAVGLDWSMKKYFRKRWSSGRIIQTNSQSILTNSRLCEPENLDTIKQTSVCSTDSPKNFSLQEKEGSLRFPDSMYAGSNVASASLPCHGMNTWFNNAKPGDCDGEGFPKLQRKSIEAVGLDWSMKKYFRKRWSSGRITQTNSQSILSNSRLCEPEHLDMMKQTSVCSTDSPKNFSLQEKEGSLRFPDSMYAGSNAASASLPCHDMNTWSNSTMPLINCKFGDGDGEGSSTIKRSSIHARYSHRTLNKYSRKLRGSGGIVQGKIESILTNGRLFNQNRECNTASSGDFFLKEKESTLKFPDCTDNGSNAGCALLPSYSLNDWSYRSVPITKYMLDVGDVDGSSKMQCTSNAIGYRPMKKYFRKHRGSGRIMQKGILNEI